MRVTDGVIFWASMFAPEDVYKASFPSQSASPSFNRIEKDFEIKVHVNVKYVCPFVSGLIINILLA